MTDEEFVRANWESVTYADTALSVIAGPYYVIVPAYPAKRKFAAYRHTAEEAWSATAEFTRETLEQIRQIEQEMEWCKAGMSDWFDPVYWRWDENERQYESVLAMRASSAREDARGWRILSRLESVRADLKKGMTQC